MVSAVEGDGVQLRKQPVGDIYWAPGHAPEILSQRSPTAHAANSG
jgi:hypothetical protein